MKFRANPDKKTVAVVVAPELTSDFRGGGFGEEKRAPH
jgi:hypothetical protein